MYDSRQNSFTLSTQKAEARGDFALSWFAHKTHYAIPKKSLESGLASGKRLVANVSRSMIQTCLDRYKPKGDYCLVVFIAVDFFFFLYFLC